MKRLLGIVLILFFFSKIIFAGNIDSSTTVCDYLKTATESFCKGKYKKAAKILKSFRNSYPDHILSEEAFYYIGLSYFESNKLDKAENIFVNILYMNTEDKISSTNEINECNHFVNNCKLRLYPEIFLNIQHEASLKLAEIGFRRKDYNMALAYIYKADTLFRYYYGCGTDDMKEDLRLSLSYSEYYEKVNQPDSAIQIMLPLILEPSAMPVKYYKEVVDRTVKLLNAKFQKEELKSLIDKAIDDTYYFETKGHDGAKPIRIYFIKFFEREIQVAPIYLFGKNYNVEEVKEYIRKSEFYAKLTGTFVESLY